MAEDFTTFDFSLREYNLLITAKPYVVQERELTDTSAGTKVPGLIFMAGTTAGAAYVEWDGTIDGTADPVAILLDTVTFDGTNSLLANVILEGVVNSQLLKVGASAPTQAQLAYLQKLGFIPTGYTNS